ncbi:hypothetical protein [Lutibaculum baratangense]|uniref:Uncharacterized protein n=1 Tax=Lutibaculum baratangense AMV1 TaxID=631454 RepID=V4TKN9_9HYPH|nr:hypothetical protein [Lutibaculum baratangense]ESR26393.1 hypothetical protein N177_0893 [Lutibaculum baratangense AMV1]
MIRTILAATALVAFAGAASADCYSGHTAQKETKPMTTAQIQSPDAQTPKQN